MKFEIGDWVLGNTKQGELIHGYVNSIHSVQGTLGIYVVLSDRKEIIGKEIETPQEGIRQLPVVAYDHEEQIRSVIDVALAVRDESWFMELSAKLEQLQSQVEKKVPVFITANAERNRLGLIFRD